MDELAELQALLGAVQKQETKYKLNERNCKELVLKLIEKGLVELIVTLDAKEYVTPAHLEKEIMDEIMSFANNPGTGVDALVRGAVTSFAFVFAHPFMDGNGRLSRFLFHKAACQDPRLANGLVLPVSVAMKRNEGDYLKALESFSKKTRRFGR